MFKKAGQPELIRSNQKDVFYVNYLRESVGYICRDFAGVYSWIKWKDELELLAEVCYFGLTTISGFQTLGEEYCTIVQVNETRRAIPSTLNRCLMIFVQAVVPYLLRKLSTKLTILSQSAETWPKGLTEKSRLWMIEVLPVLEQSIMFLHRAHLTLFYLNGLFYHLSKRVTSINYVLVRSGLKDVSSRPTYRLLGYLSALQLALSLLFSAYKFRFSKLSISGQTSIENTKPESSNAVKKQPSNKHVKCSLCLEPLHDVTTTPCGHLFDWYCIAEWCSTKQECPLCRETVQLSRLVHLHHFDCS